ncbi:alpha/beta fold hydrolase [Xanthomonas albilineans]|uniref:Putative hydrolase of the alpha/beta fold superfamily protein n=1 Tax=Xanthomonas albilineans (strain GPE PC73 / CFBP 7063) TaxID=380358 RepID=D2UGR3_XANAP|nr:alpha/beta fold hydrolase [Xanthomonas albilineans]QHQ29834.1 putative hydrolase of the alpha/beta fold superfamily protein [Xanthomonas albilineans]CBA17574.1 putative hydrolase of the alpha/beta fold superfamily protein [Xanthomonas albilineans GPE PC73]
MNATDYSPPRWLRNPHVQSVLGSSLFRVRRGEQLLIASGAITTSHILDGGDGVRLQGWLSVPADVAPRGTVLLLHGWEGSADSSYMCLTAAQMVAHGYQVFRLNFRDHGDTHHLNVDLFHSDRLDEVFNAACDLWRRFPAPTLLVAGYSLGGNFALRLALRAPVAGLPLQRVAAVCPLLDPAAAMQRVENGPQFYDWYFRRNWRGSLMRKRELFPDQHGYDDATLALDMRGLMGWLAQRHAGFASLDEYFDSYSIAGERLLGLRVPADILMAEDDPVIPLDDFRSLRLPAVARLEIARWGGHCGFIENARGDGFAERWVAERLTQGLAQS